LKAIVFTRPGFGYALIIWNENHIGIKTDGHPDAKFHLSPSTRSFGHTQCRYVGEREYTEI